MGYVVKSYYDEPRPGTPTGKHKGIDLDYSDLRIPLPFEPIVGLVFSDKTFGYDIHANELVDYAVILEGEQYYHAYFHLQKFSLPRNVQEIQSRHYVAIHVIGHPAWGRHVHYAVFKKSGKFTTVSDYESRGLAIDPLPHMEGGDDQMFPLEERVKVADVIYAIRKELEGYDTTQEEKVRFIKEGWEKYGDHLETIRTFLRAGKAKLQQGANLEPAKQHAREIIRILGGDE